MKEKNLFLYWIRLILIGMLLISCIQHTQRDFTDADLLIDKAEIPNDWSVFEVSSEWLSNEGQESGVDLIFQANNTELLVRGGETIYRYKNSLIALWNYKRFERENFNDQGYYVTSRWVIPDGFTFTGSVADRWRFACAGDNFSLGSLTGKTSTICIYLAQYEEFLVFSPITIERDGVYYITMEEITHLVDAIDHKMGQYLNQQ